MILILYQTTAGFFQQELRKEIYAVAQDDNNSGNNFLDKKEAFNPTKKLKIVLEETEIEIAPGKKIKTWAFNGTVPWTSFEIYRRRKREHFICK